MKDLKTKGPWEPAIKSSGKQGPVQVPDKMGSRFRIRAVFALTGTAHYFLFTSSPCAFHVSAYWNA
jgi:hypothetical protein